MNETQHSDNSLQNEELSSLYQQSKIEQPPMSLDSSILSQARKAVEKKEVKSWWQLHWLIPAASSAMILLAVTVTWQNRNSDMFFDSTVATMSDSKQVQTQAFLNQQKKVEKLGSIREVEEKVAYVPAETLKAQTSTPATFAEAELSFDMAEPVPQVSKIPKKNHKKKQASSSNFSAKPSADKAFSRQASSVATDSLSKEETKPETWLEEIEKLLQQGKETQAHKELKAFQKQFPDYEIPKALLNKFSTEPNSLDTLMK